MEVIISLGYFNYISSVISICVEKIFFLKIHVQSNWNKNNYVSSYFPD